MFLPRLRLLPRALISSKECANLGLDSISAPTKNFEYSHSSK